MEQISSDTLSRWSKSISDTLDNRRGRAKFRQFLESEFPGRSTLLDTLDFWKECIDLMDDTTKSEAERQKAVRELAVRLDSGDYRDTVDVNEGVIDRMKTATSTVDLNAALQEAISGNRNLENVHTQFKEWLMDPRHTRATGHRQWYQYCTLQ